jgi:hypothetical protein
VPSPEHLIEQGGEFTVPVFDQRSEVFGSITQIEHQVAGLLGEPRGGRVRRDTEDCARRDEQTVTVDPG